MGKFVFLENNGKFYRANTKTGETWVMTNGGKWVKVPEDTEVTK